MREPFFRQLFPPVYRVLGRTLPPLSLWHVAALEAINSPFVQPHGSGGRTELSDVQIAVQICLTRWPDQPRLEPTLRHWLQQFFYRGSSRYVRRHAQAFAAYFQCHSAPPELWEDEKTAPRFLTAPSVLSRVAGLSCFPAYTVDSIWNDVTPGYALWLLCANAERQTGALRFATEEDDEPDNLPDLKAKSDEELYKIAVREMGEAKAKLWLERRKKTRAEGGRLHGNEEGE
jgi:hypothetical protein